MISIENETVLCITGSYWDEPKRSRHHLMRVLSEKNTVVWVEKVLSFTELSFQNLPKFFLFVKPPRQVKKKLWVITPPPAIPLLDKLPWLEYLNDYILCAFIKYKLKRIGLKTSILWIYAYYLDFLVDKFNEKVSIYFCNDPFGAWDKSRRIRKEKKLCKKVDLLLTPSKFLTQEKKVLNPNSHTILHGVDTGVYKKELSAAVPDDMKEIPKPIICYSGPVREIVDIDLIRFLARSRPAWSIVLVGPMIELTNEKRKKWNRLREPNIYLLGAKDLKELPNYLRESEVSIFPYNTDFFAQYHYCQIPLKYFEYLSMGKPIVSTAYCKYEGAPPEFHEIAQDYPDFLKKIEKCLREDSPENQRKRIRYARKNSWQRRLEEIALYIQEIKAK